MDDFDNFQKNRKIFICLGTTFLIILFLVIFVFANFNNVFSSGNYVIAGSKLILKSKGNEWVQVTPKDIKNSSLIVYNGMDKIKATKFDYDDGVWHFYDGQKKLNIGNFNIAYSSGMNIKPFDYLIEGYDSSDEELLIDVVNSDSADDFKLYRNTLRKVKADFDGDGSIETLYVTSDFIFGNGYRTPYSYMFLVKDGDVVDSIFEIDNNVYNIINILDMNDDGLYEVIVSKGAMPSEDFDSCYQIYNIKNGNIKLFQDCR